MGFSDFFRHAWILIRSAGVAGCVGVTVFELIGSVHLVNGSSMQPVLNPGPERDFVFVKRWDAKRFEFQRGEIVCLTSPRNPKQVLIKRIIGLEGDIVRTINYRESFVRIPQGHCWVEGENHKVSLDSNRYGPVPIGLIIGKASHIVWPLKRWSQLDTDLPIERNPFL